MTNFEESLGEPQTAVTVQGAQHLGHIGLHESTIGPELPPIDIEIEGLEPAHYAPAGARPYEGTAKRGITIFESDEQGEQAIAYASTLFPDTNFKYLGYGRYGVVLADDNGKAYKVYRWAAQSYSRYEREAGALQLLSKAGVAPKLHLFIDAGEEFRLDRKAYDYDYTQFGFEDVQIPRQNSGRELPVMVMDQVEAEPLETADPAKLVDGFCKVADVFIRGNIQCWDAEPVVDKKTGEVIMLDVGELWQKPFDEGSATAHEKLAHETEILLGVALHYGLQSRANHIKRAYSEGGIDSVRQYLSDQLVRG